MDQTKAKIVLDGNLMAILNKQGASINTEPVWVKSKDVLTLPAGTYDVITQTSKYGSFRVVRLNQDFYDLPKGFMVSIPVHRKASVTDNGCQFSLFTAARNFTTTGGSVIAKGAQKIFATA